MAWLAVFLALLIVYQSPARAGVSRAGQIFVVLSEDGPAYRNVAKAFSSSLPSQYGAKTAVLDDLQDQDILRLDVKGNLIVPVGVRAAQRVGGLHLEHASILSLMVPREAVEEIFKDDGEDGRASSVYIDQPLFRSLAFIRLLLPKAKRVGLILSKADLGDLAHYRREAARAKLALSVETVSESFDVPQALRHLLPRMDVFLMLPDPKVVNANTVRLILLASYDRQIPVVGFSRGLTTAGAVAAVVSDPAQIGREGARMIGLWDPKTGALPPSRYSSEFSLVFNHMVARSLGVDFPEDSRELVQWRKALK